MASMPFPGVKALDAFLHQYLAHTPLSHLTPYDYALQYLELPLDQPHDLEETYELFWGVCCLEDEFRAFKRTLPRIEEEPKREQRQSVVAAAIDLSPAPHTRQQHRVEPIVTRSVTAAAAAPRRVEPAVRPIPPPRVQPAVRPISPPRVQPVIKVTKQSETGDQALDEEKQAKLDAEKQAKHKEQIETLERIHRETRKIELENRIMEDNIARLAERLRKTTLHRPTVSDEADTAETSGLFDSISLSSTPNTSAFDSIEAKLEEYKATIRGKINDRYHSIDGIAATADAHQQKIRARLSRL